MTISGFSKVALILLLLGGGTLVFLRWFERSRLFWPSPDLGADPGSLHLSFSEVEFPATDGTLLRGWWIPAPGARGTVLYCHGNAGNIGDRLESVLALHRLAVNVFIFDYRGYGKSAGVPSERGTYRDAAGAHDYLTRKLGISPRKIFILGRSLGGAIAIELARKREAAGLICEASFASVEMMGRLYYPYLPASLFLFDRYDSLSRVAGLTLPQIYLHSRDDDLVPFEQGEMLYRAAARPKKFVVISGEHARGLEDAPEEYLPALDKFIASCLGQTLPGPGRAGTPPPPGENARPQTG